MLSNLRVFQFIICMLIGFVSNSAFAQIMDSTATTFDPADYTPIHFSQLLEIPADDNEAYRWTHVSGLREDLVKARVFYTGQRRKTESLHPAVLGAWVQARNLKARVNWFFDTEMEFTDGKNVIWLPVINLALDKIKGAKPKGEIEIFVHRLDLSSIGSASIVMSMQLLSEPSSTPMVPPVKIELDHYRYVRGNLNFVIGEQPISLPLVTPSSLDTVASGKKALNLKFESAEGVGRLRIENIIGPGLYEFQEMDILVPLANGGQGRVSNVGCKAEIGHIDEAGIKGNILCPARQLGEVPPDINFNAEIK